MKKGHPTREWLNQAMTASVYFHSCAFFREKNIVEERGNMYLIAYATRITLLKQGQCNPMNLANVVLNTIIFWVRLSYIQCNLRLASEISSSPLYSMLFIFYS